MLRFLHLSDIHFEAKEHSLSDRNRDISERIVEHICGTWRGKSFDAILVTGDIAFSGQRAEYDRALAWLARVQECLSVNTVLVVPGNHDIDRTSHRLSAALRNSILSLKNASSDKVSRLLGQLLEDELTSAHLMRPLQEYIAFAEGLGCGISRANVVWSREFKLSSSLDLVIHGLNSVFACDATDRQGGVVLGEFQALLPSYRPGAVHLTMCHHPVDWLADYDASERALSRAAIQLYGHKHMRRVQRVDDSILRRHRRSISRIQLARLDTFLRSCRGVAKPREGADDDPGRRHSLCLG